MSRGHNTGDRSCPLSAELAAFLCGELPPPAMDEVGEHVSNCPACEAAVRRMEEVTSVTFKGANRRSEKPAGGLLTAVQTHPPGAVLTPAPDVPPVPAQLGQYRLGEPLGRGGMGTVYRAEHVRLKKSVAIKVLDPNLIRDRRAVARFHREMEVVGRLDHPNLVRATDAGDADGVHFLVMELIDGKTFSALLHERGPLPVPEACELARQAALGLQGAHEHGLVHRDVKPSNLMLSSSGQVKLLDLGLARLRFAGADELTLAGEVMGTAEYMAPEQWAKTHAVDIRADIYSLGCTLFALLTGDAPFPGSGPGSFLRLMCAHQQDPVPVVTDRRADAPPALCDLLTRLLAKAPDDRPATPGAVAAELALLARGAERTGPAAAGATTVPNYRPGLPLRKVPRRGWVLLAVALVASAATALGAYVLRAPAGAAVNREEREPVHNEPADPKKWRNLLTERPTERLWRPTDVSLIYHKADKEVLTVQSSRPALLKLGDTTAQGYKLQLGFQQVRWTGGVGVYFGGGTGAPNEFACQIVALRHLEYGPGRQYGLVRSQGLVAPDGAAPAFRTNGIMTGYTASPGNEEQILEIEIKPNGLSFVRWNGIACPELVNKPAETRANQLFPSDPHLAGEFGVYCEGAAVTVSTARYLFIE